MTVIRLECVLICDFCGEDEHQAAHLIAGPVPLDVSRTPAICDKCVDLCAEVIAEQRANKEAGHG